MGVYALAMIHITYGDGFYEAQENRSRQNFYDGIVNYGTE